MKILVNQTSLLNDSEDMQCTDNRSGVLCGGCRDNFSLALGSNRCLHGCSNNSLSLIIAFAAAGIALVFFIKILNLTVSQGTINGLIFYANIVGVEQTVLFSSEDIWNIFRSVFIAWVNLDLGIETCFFDGMDAYTYVKHGYSLSSHYIFGPLLYSSSSFPTTPYVPLRYLETILFLYWQPSSSLPTPSCCEQSSLHYQLQIYNFSMALHNVSVGDEMAASSTSLANTFLCLCFP